VLVGVFGVVMEAAFLPGFDLFFLDAINGELVVNNQDKQN
jgi:hypothetical protein